MQLSRWMTGFGLGVLCTAGTMLAPALQAQEGSRIDRVAGARTSAAENALGAFTPAAADPKLAAILARSGLPERGFRFTPSEASGNSRNAVTMAVRARSARTSGAAENSVLAPPRAVSLAPIAYNLGVAVGWNRFAISGDVTRVELVSQPAIRERADLGLSYTGKRIAGRVPATVDRPLIDTPIMTSEKPSYSVNLGSSYSLTRNLDVTAGLRYKSDRDRLPRIDNDRRDNQAVYVGTAFRF